MAACYGIFYNAFSTEIWCPLKKVGQVRINFTPVGTGSRILQAERNVRND